jgi:anti-sigma regulatory factor (Ser/Thr protein kinase)
MLLTELVNNAVVHGSRRAADAVDVTVRKTTSRLRVEVRDSGPGFEWNGPPEERERSSGWGLVLVDALADRWGIERSTGRTCVWFEV